MPHTLREFHRPAEEADAIELLQRAETASAALIHGPRVPEDWLAGIEAAVDLGRLGLAYIVEDEDGTLRLGALTTLRDLAEAPVLQSMAGGILAGAVRASAASALRQAATVGGTLLARPEVVAGKPRTGPPELLLALLALDTQLVFRDAWAASRSVPLHQHLAGGAAVPRGELLVEARFQRPAAGAGAALAGVGRTPRDQSIVAAAALVEPAAGQRRVRLAVAGASPFPMRVDAAEDVLHANPPAGGQLDAERLSAIVQAVEAAVSPVTDFRASADYKRAMAGVLAERALRQAWRAADQRA